MPFTFVRPADTRVLETRPVLDIGTGDGQTIRSLIGADSGIVGVDRSIELLSSTGLAHVACADAAALPFADGSFSTVLAADLFHHVDDLERVIAEIRRVLRPDGALVAWWYANAAHEAPDAPRFPRSFDEVAALWPGAEPLELEIVLGGGPPTVGLLGRR
jgi:SAM-dependent methyltransferase